MADCVKFKGTNRHVHRRLKRSFIRIIQLLTLHSIHRFKPSFCDWNHATFLVIQRWPSPLGRSINIKHQILDTAFPVSYKCATAESILSLAAEWDGNRMRLHVDIMMNFGYLFCNQVCFNCFICVLFVKWC